MQPLYAEKNTRNGGTTMVLGQMNSNNSITSSQNADITRQNQNFKNQNTVKSAQNSVLNTQKPSLAKSMANTYPIKAAEEGQRAVQGAQNTGNGDVFEDSKKKRVKKIAVAAGIIAAGALLLAAYMRFGKTKNTPPAPSNGSKVNSHNGFSDFTLGENAQREDVSSILGSNNTPSEPNCNSLTEQRAAESAPKENLRIHITSDRNKIQTQTGQNNQPDKAPRITIHNDNELNQNSNRLTYENAAQEGTPRITIHKEEALTVDLCDVDNSVQGINQETARVSQDRDTNGLQTVADSNTARQNTSQTLTENDFDRMLGGNYYEGIRQLIEKKNPTAQDLMEIERIFTDYTKINLHCADTWHINKFEPFFNNMLANRFYKYLDSEIKHIVIGHGIGSSMTGNWRFIGSNTNVFDYVESKIPKGEKVLMLTCESGKAIKPGVGGPVSTVLTCAQMPGKIIESGKRQIIGTVTLLGRNGKIQYF